MDINMDSLQKQKNIIINILVLALAAGIAYNIYKKGVVKENTLKLERENQIKKNEVFAKIGELNKSYGAYKKFINSKDASSMINALNDIAKEEDVKINSIRPQAIREDQDYLYYSFALAISVSDYHRLGRFISRLESSSDVYSVVNLGLRSPYEARGAVMEGQEDVLVDLGISAFLLK